MKYAGTNGAVVEIEGDPPYDGHEMAHVTRDGRTEDVRLGTLMAMTNGRGVDFDQPVA